MRRLFLTSITILVLLGAASIALLSSLSAFSWVYSSYGGQCRSIGRMAGAEDLAIDYDTGVAFISSYNRRMARRNGTIHRLSLDGSDTLVPMKLEGVPDGVPFFPHGVDLRTINGTQYLFVVNHRSGSDPSAGHDVYVFGVGKDTLTLVRHHRDIGIRSPNDVAAIDLDTFYFTNDRGAFDPVGNMVEMVFARQISDLSVFDNGTTRKLADMAFANGVATTASGATVYATALREGVLKEFSRDPATNALTLVREIPVGNAPDNISIADDGALWVASHVNLIAFNGHIEDSSWPSPFQIYRVDPQTGASTMILEDNGDVQSSVSVAAPYRDAILLGSAFQRSVKVCAF